MNWTQKWLLPLAFYLATIAWFVLVAAGLVFVTMPETGRHSHVIGWAALTIGLVVLVTTMDRWIRHAQIFLGFGIMGGVLCFYRGHLLGSQIPFPRLLAAVLTLTLVGCSWIIGTLAERRLRWFDRVVLVVFVAAFTSALVPASPVTVVTRLMSALGALLALWIYHRYSGNQGKPKDGKASVLHVLGF